jgi:cellulose synthase/poly-beta-1,6-N-acetylglucosamine synthase-like glycosyltransferase
MMQDTFAVFYRLRFLNYYAKVEVPPPMQKPPFVSIVIACPNNSWMLEESLSAMNRQTYREFEVIVLPDSEIEDLKRDNYSYDLRIIPTGKVRPAEKRNIGIENVKGDIVAFIDDDAYADPSWLANAVKYFSEPSIGGVGGPGVTPPGDSFFAKAGGRVYGNVFVSGNYRYRYLAGRVRLDVDDYPSCNLFVRTDILRKIGGYRTDFWPGEDTLLCESIVLGEHKRIVYDPWVVVYHHRRRLFAAHLRQLGRYGFHRGYFVKRFPATSCKLSYFIPSLFVLALFFGAFVFLTPFTFLHILYTVSFGIYLALITLSSITLNLPMWITTVLGVFASHVCYGIRFMQGLLSSRAPCEYIGGDHADGKNNVKSRKGENK